MDSTSESKATSKVVVSQSSTNANRLPPPVANSVVAAAIYPHQSSGAVDPPSTIRPSAQFTRSVASSNSSAEESAKANMSAVAATIHSVSNPANAAQLQCPYCLGAAVNAALADCGHQVGCLECSTQLKQNGDLCPQCRHAIKGVRPIGR